MGGNKKRRHQRVLNVKCQECDRYFPTKSHMNKHLHRMHKNERDYICPQCGSLHDNLHDFNWHMRQRHKVGHFCRVCGEAFSKQTLRGIHEKEAHHFIASQANLPEEADQQPAIFSALIKQATYKVLDQLGNSGLNRQPEYDQPGSSMHPNDFSSYVQQSTSQIFDKIKNTPIQQVRPEVLMNDFPHRRQAVSRTNPNEPIRQEYINVEASKISDQQAKINQQLAQLETNQAPIGGIDAYKKMFKSGIHRPPPNVQNFNNVPSNSCRQPTRFQPPNPTFNPQVYQQPPIMPPDFNCPPNFYLQQQIPHELSRNFHQPPVNTYREESQRRLISPDHYREAPHHRPISPYREESQRRPISPDHYREAPHCRPILPKAPELYPRQNSHYDQRAYESRRRSISPKAPELYPRSHPESHPLDDNYVRRVETNEYGQIIKSGIYNDSEMMSEDQQRRELEEYDRRMRSSRHSPPTQRPNNYDRPSSSYSHYDQSSSRHYNPY